MGFPIRVIRPSGEDDADIDAESIIEAIMGGEGGDVEDNLPSGAVVLRTVSAGDDEEGPTLFNKILEMVMNPDSVIVIPNSPGDAEIAGRFASWLNIRKGNEPVPDWVTNSELEIPEEAKIHAGGGPMVFYEKPSSKKRRHLVSTGAGFRYFQ